MKERVTFVLEWEKRWNKGEGVLNFAELCRELGISRQVGYDAKAIAERSRRPLRSPTKVPDDVEELLVGRGRQTGTPCRAG